MLISAEVSRCVHVVVTQREKTASGVLVSFQLEFDQSCSVESHGIAGGILAMPDGSTSSPLSQLVSWPV